MNFLDPSGNFTVAQALVVIAAAIIVYEVYEYEEGVKMAADSAAQYRNAEEQELDQLENMQNGRPVNPNICPQTQQAELNFYRTLSQSAITQPPGTLMTGPVSAPTDAISSASIITNDALTRAATAQNQQQVNSANSNNNNGGNQ